MTHILRCITKESGKEMYMLQMSGHAGYNPGNDIVCSALSTLIVTFAETLLQKGIPTVYNITSGYAKVECEYTEAVKDIILTIETGIELIAKQYSQNVSLDSEWINN